MKTYSSYRANVSEEGFTNKTRGSTQTVVGGVLVGLFNVTLLSVFRNQIALLFTQDPEVIKLVAQTLPVCAIMQLFDGMAAVSHGLLRGIGRQEIGGYVNLIAYYVVALPISFGLGFGLGWNLVGLWMGVTFGLLLFVYPSSFSPLRHDPSSFERTANLECRVIVGCRWLSIGLSGIPIGIWLPGRLKIEMLLVRRPGGRSKAQAFVGVPICCNKDGRMHITTSL